MEMQPTIDEVYEAVRESRHRGPDALAALALRYGADAVGWMIRHDAMRRELLDAERGMDEAREERDSLRSERDAAQHSTEEARQQCERALDAAAVCARQRDEARSRASMLAQDIARAVEERDRAVEERDRAVQDRARIAMEERERDRAVQEREAFSLRLSAAEHARDENRNAWAEACRERDARRADAEHLRGVLDALSERLHTATRERDEAVRERDEARAERDALRDRPTYESRTTPPTLAEREAHQAAGGAWLVSRIDSDGKLYSDVLIGWCGWRWEGCFFVALDAERRPCAWPVPAVEVTP